MPRRPTALRTLVAAPAVLLWLLAAPAAYAVTFDVTAASDGSDVMPGDGLCRTAFDAATARCSLRAAIEEANALTGTELLHLETARFEPASALPAISGSVELAGNGSRQTVVDGNGHGPVLRTSAGAVVIRAMTLTGGSATSTDGGGGVVNTGAITTIDGVAVIGNTASAPIGGARGGGVANRGGSMAILRSLVTGNRAEPTGLGADGDGLGGGVYSDAPLTIAHSTIHANTARATLGSASYGGGLVVAGSIALLRHVTLSDNDAGGGGGGNLWSGGGSGVELRDSILTGGIALAGTENCGGAVPLTSGRNLDSGNTCALAGDGIPNTDPLLEPLSAVGGSLDARPPLSASPVVGVASECALDRDQRGSALPVGAACDLGAVDHSTDLRAGIAASRTPVPAGQEVTLTLSGLSVGLDPLGSAAVQVDVPPGVEFVRAIGPSGDCSGPPHQGVPVVFCPLGAVARATEVRAFVTVRAPGAGVMTFTASVVSGLGESPGANDSATILLPVASKLPAKPRAGTRPKSCSVTRRGTLRANRMTGTEGSDRLVGGKGADRLDGRGGEDCLAGQEGDDVLIGGRGRDDLSGGAGADRISARDGKRDTVRCGTGRDRVTVDRFDRVAPDCESVARR